MSGHRLTSSAIRRASPELSFSGHDCRDRPDDLGQQLRSEVGSAGGGVVVDHHRQIGRRGHVAEEPQQLAPVGAVQQRRQCHHAVGPGALGIARVLRGLLGGRRRHAGAHRSPPGGRLNDGRDHRTALLAAEAAALADGAVGDDPVDPAVDQALDLGGHRLVIDSQGGVEMRDDRGVNTLH